MSSMSPTVILFLQSMLITLQIVNAGLATIPGLPVAVPLVAAAVFGGFQFFVQNLGNLSMPPDKLTTRIVTETLTPATAMKPAVAVQTTTTKTEPLPESGEKTVIPVG